MTLVMEVQMVSPMSLTPGNLSMPLAKTLIRTELHHDQHSANHQSKHGVVMQGKTCHEHEGADLRGRRRR